MNTSLQKRLSIWLSLAIVAIGLVAGGLSFWLAYNEAQEFQDDSLRQIALLMGSDHLPSDGQRSAAAIDNDPDARIFVQRLASSQVTTARLALPARMEVGFHTLDIDGTQWRLYVRTFQSGEQVAVSQEIEVRGDAARNSALRTLLPLIVLIPLLAFFSRRLVRASLAPVRALSHVADKQSEDRPSALSTAQVPDEIIPFVESINRLLERISRLVEQQRRFIADAAHELRTPLTALSLQVQNLERADTLAACKERLLPLKTGLERSRHLLDQLLNLARQQASTGNRQQVDLVEVARDVIEDLFPFAELKHIDLGIGQQEKIWINADTSAIYMLIRNAVDNALRYTPEGGEVTIHVRRDADIGLVEVIDSGPGIPEGERERVFDTFYRMPGSADGGSGLGLAIARSIADRLGGNITLEGRKGRNGTVFAYRQRLIAL
ncbi:MAG: HAMP domain-containing histidine kinase [Glaciimonas sp.]|nr:HAMP domain-containing histidine kinase [Glaciimonas sp.]